MIFNDTKDLSEWLLKKLPEICKANPQTLTDYILALIKKAKSERDLINNCEEALYDFLKKKTNGFIEDLIKHMNEKNYFSVFKDIKIEESQIKNNTEKINIVKSTTKNDNNLSDSEGEFWHNRSPNLHSKAKNNRRSKSREVTKDRNKSPISNHRHKRTRERSRHNSYSSGKRRRYDRHSKYNSKHRDSSEKEDYYRRRLPSRNRTHRSRHSEDKNNRPRRDNDRGKDYNDTNSLVSSKNFKISCANFVDKGVCMKGDACEFDHGHNIVRDFNCIYAGSDINQNLMNNNWKGSVTGDAWMSGFAATSNNPHIMNLTPINNQNMSTTNDLRKKRKKSGVYDPSHPEIDGTNNNIVNNGNSIVTSTQNESIAPVYVPSGMDVNDSNIAADVDTDSEALWWRECSNDKNTINNNNNNNENVPSQPKFSNNQQTYQRKFNNRNNNNNGMQKRNYNNNNNNNYHNQSNAKCLLLTHIPIELNDEVQLQHHFQQFGVVTDVVVGFQGESHNTLIEFASVDQAKSAFKSPAPILDNRFIRTSLYTRQTDSSCNNNNGVVGGINLHQNYNDTTEEYPPFRAESYQNTSGSRRKVQPEPTLMRLSEPDGDTDDNNYGKWNRRSRLISNTSSVSANEYEHKPPTQQPNQPNKFKTYLPRPNELKLDRRKASVTLALQVVKPTTVSVVDSTAVVPPSTCNEVKPAVSTSIVKDPQQQQQQQDVIKENIARLEISLDNCKNRLRHLIDECKDPSCDQTLIKRQITESYRYFNELKSMHENLVLKSKKAEVKPISEEEKLKQLITKAQADLSNLERETEEYKNQLKQITELKRKLINFNSANIKQARGGRLPKRDDMKLDNRPKILYLTLVNQNISIEQMKGLFKNYLVDKIDTSDNEINYFGIDFKTRKEADRAIKDFAKFFIDKNITASFKKPESLCDPLGFSSKMKNECINVSNNSTTINTNNNNKTTKVPTTVPMVTEKHERGTPRLQEDCISSEDDDDVTNHNAI